MAKFAANNNNFVFIKLFLFFASRNLHSRISFNVFDLLDIITCIKLPRKGYGCFYSYVSNIEMS